MEEAEVKLPKCDSANDCCICTYQTASTKPYLGHTVKKQELSGQHDLPVGIKCTEFTAVIR